MTRGLNFYSQECYAIERGQYVLYFGKARVLVTRAVAVLLDTRLGMLITHGDPISVRRELDEMRRVSRASGAIHYDEDWLLLEGRPDLEGLNAVLRNASDTISVRDAFAGESERIALKVMQKLLERVSRRE